MRKRRHDRAGSQQGLEAGDGDVVLTVNNCEAGHHTKERESWPEPIAADKNELRLPKSRRSSSPDETPEAPEAEEDPGGQLRGPGRRGLRMIGGGRCVLDVK